MLRRRKREGRSGRVGQRIKVCGGYECEPGWLGGRDAVWGVVDSWLPGQHTNAACLVRLDAPLTAEGDVRGTRKTVTGEYVILETRYAGQTWDRSGTVHVELCREKPPPLPWAERSPGAWVEDHATYEVVD